MLSALFGALFTTAAALAFGRIATRRLDVPLPIAFAAGVAILHLIIFAMMIAGQARTIPLALIGSPALLLVVPVLRPVVQLPRPPLWIAAIVAPFALVYVVNALAPEIQADANAYHLIPAIEAARMGGFSHNVSFYDFLPHATELLFVHAYAFGGVPAAKLVHLGFLFWTLPLIAVIARQIRLPDPAGSAAAAMYFVTPVVGVSGASAFNDAALVFYVLAGVWVLLALRARYSLSLALLAGVLAGMCYAVKMNGGIAILAAGAFLLALRRWRALPVFCVGVAVMTGPWLLRNWIIAGNPFAPFFNAWFPNPYFYVVIEQQLGQSLRSYGVPFPYRFWELAAGARLHGMIGPAFLLAPLTLLAVRRRSIRGLWLLAIIFSAGWWLNAGARFLLPALPFLALAMMSVLPRAPLLVIHAVLSWPWILFEYSPWTWRLAEFPWRNVTAIESTDAYLTRVSGDYRLARMVEQNTPRDARILDLTGLHRAHIDRQIFGPWQTAEGHRLISALDLARAGTLDEWRASFEPRPVFAVRIRRCGSSTTNWSINELMLSLAGERLKNSNQWTLYSNRNPWDLPIAFDRNRTSRWSTWQRSESEDYVLVELGRFETLDTVAIVMPSRESDAQVSIEVRNPGGGWTMLQTARRRAAPLRLRAHAISLLARSGVTHIVTPVATQGIGVLGNSLVNEADDWGLKVVDNMHIHYVLQVPQTP